MSLSNELSSVLLKVSHLVARDTRTLYLNVFLFTSCGVQAGGHLLNRVLGFDTFRFHLLNFFVHFR